MSASDNTLVETLAAHLSGKRGDVETSKLAGLFADHPYADLMAALRELEERGMGRLIIGRQGYKTRFQLKNGPSAAKENPEGVVQHQRAVESNHVLVLRRDPLVRIAVPSDITSQEADRLANWVKTLPLD